MDALKDPLRRLAWRLRALAGRDVYHPVTLRARTAVFGGQNGYGAWTLAPDALGPAPVVYSFGIGRDLSFDLDLVDRLGAEVHAFDPTPASLEWVADQRLPDGLTVHPVGLADYDGSATFYAPTNPAFVSHSMVQSEASAGTAVEVRVARLSTLMEQLGHDRLDLLKLDIEGAEYAALKDFAGSDLDVRQLLVEFHHRQSAFEPEQTAAALRLLGEAGYRVFAVSPRGEEYSLLRVDS